MFVGGVIVGDQMDLKVGGNIAVRVVAKTQELLMAMAGLALGDDAAIEHIERRKQRGSARSSAWPPWAWCAAPG